MAYNKKTWTNRTSEYPNRYRMTSVNGNIADVAIVPNEGNVTAEGDKFSADTMNDMETRIKNGFDSADSSISTLNTTLRGLISSEQTRATGVETLIQADVDALESNLASEVSRATGAETTLTNNLASEVTRATGVENGHNTRITSLESRMDNAESDIDTLESAIAGFQTSLDTEVTRATEAEDELRGDVTNLNSAVSDLEAITTRAYKASGSLYFVDLPAAVESRQGNTYDILDAFTTTSEFLEGPGKEYPAHTDVVIVGVEGDYYNEVTPSGEENPSEEGWYVYDSTEEKYVLTEDTSVQSGTTYYSYANVKYMYNIGTGFFDTSNFVQKTDYATLFAAGIVKPDGTTTTIDENGVLSALGGGQGSAEAAERMIAPIEADATASTRPYAVGAKLILNEVLYKAKTAIEIGDELVIGTNIEASDDVSTQINDANAELQTLADNDSAMLNVLGAKNLCPNNYTTQVLHGLTITVKDNGEVWVSGSIESGTNSVSMQINDGLPSGNEALIMTGCPANGSGESYRLMAVLDNDTRYFDEGNGVIIPANSSISRVNIVIYRNNGQIYDLKFKPMIRPASVEDDTYVPYAMTNRELTTDKAEKSDLASISATGTTNNTGSTIAKDAYFYLNGALVKSKTSIANNATFTLGTNYEVVTAGGLNRSAVHVKAFQVTLTANIAKQITIDISDYGLDRSPEVINITSTASEMMNASTFLWYVRTFNPTQVVIGIKMDISITDVTFVLHFR